MPSERYADGLRHAIRNEWDDVLQCFWLPWENREDTPDDQQSSALAAGVGVAAYLELFDSGESNMDGQEILETVEPNQAELSPAVHAVFEYLMTGDTDTTPGELIEVVSAKMAAVEEPTLDDLDDEDLETAAFAELLGLLLSTDLEPAEIVMAVYPGGVRHVLQEEFNEAVQAFYTVWEQRDAVDEDDHEFAHVLAAGVGFGAVTRLYDEEEIVENGEAVLAEIQEPEDWLVEPALALYEYLTEGETDATPDELREDIDEDSEELEFSELETYAHAGLLEAHQKRDEE